MTAPGGTTYTLARDGDPLEQYTWTAFLSRAWPSYQTYWQRCVVPLTKRPKPGIEIHWLPKVNLSLER